jgi:hypothetical protein
MAKTFPFTGADGDPLSSDFVDIYGAGFEIQDNRAVAADLSTETKAKSVVTGAADDRVSAIVNGNGVATKANGIAFRMTPDGLSGFSAAIIGSTGEYVLQRHENELNATFTPSSYTIPNFDNSADYKIDAEFIGNDLYFYLNDVEIESMRKTVAGDFSSNTLHGLVASNDGLASFDDLTIDSLEDAAVEPEPEPEPEPTPDVIPINTPYNLQGMGRKITKLGRLFRKPSTMSHPEEYWTRCMHTEGMNFWPSERYPVIMYSSTDHDTGDGGLWVRVYDKDAGGFEDPAAWLEWDDVSGRSEFDHITQKTNPIVDAGSGRQMETPQPRVMADGSVRVYFHMQGVEIFDGGPSMQGTKYIGFENGIDRTQTGVTTETEYDFRYKTGDGHSGYFEVGDNTIDEIGKSFIGVCLHGGGNEVINNGQQVLVSDDYGSWSLQAYYRRYNLDLMEFNPAGESDFVYPLDVVRDAKREGNFYRVIAKYRPQSAGGNEAYTRPAEFLVDDKFRAVSEPNFFFPLGGSGEFDEEEAITPQEFIYDNKVYFFYKTTESDGISSIGLATVIDEPKTWVIHHPYNDMQEFISVESDGVTAASGVTYSGAAVGRTESDMKLTSITMLSDGSYSTVLSNASFDLDAYQHSLIEFPYIGKDTGADVELEFGLIDDIQSEAKKISLVFPSRVNDEEKAAIQCKVVGSTVAIDGVIGQYVGQDDTVSATTAETVTAKHILGFRVSPDLNELAIMSGSSVIAKFDISGFNYGTTLTPFIRARLTDASQTTDETVSFSAIRASSFSSEPVAALSAPALTALKTTDSITLSASGVSGASAYKYFLNGIETDNGVYSGLDPATTYTAYARATNTSADSAPSIVQLVTTSPEEVPNTPPTANAGADKSVFAGQRIELDGLGSTAGCQTYTWSQESGETVTIFNNGSAHAVIFAPVLDVENTVTMGLIVSKGGVSSAKDTVTFTVAPKQGGKLSASKLVK